VEWLCLPRPDSPSIFGALLDRTAGTFRFGPTNVQVPDQRRYIPGTMMLETTWHTPTGWLIVNDFLVVKPVEEEKRRPEYRRAPSDAAATGTLVRTATCTGGRVEVLVNCLPLFNYGTTPGQWSYEGEGYKSATVVGGESQLKVTSSIRLALEAARCYGRTTLEEGQSAFVALSWLDYAPTTVDQAALDALITAEYWRNWLATGTFPDHPWRQWIERSALTLKGLSYAPTGAIMAAATTGLPETPGGERNWDYRYTWIRDSGFMLRSLFRLGFDWEALEYFAFVLDAVSGGANRPVATSCRSCTASGASGT
jgi:GH15 family glucan-1,4-alpha-glucosidase